jgi:hypothetical protein
MTSTERFGKVLKYFAGAVALGTLFSAFRCPFFIGWDIQQDWFLQNPSSLEGNVLVFTSILIGEVHGTENDRTIILFSIHGVDTI